MTGFESPYISAARQAADAVALVSSHVSLTYGALGRAIAGVAVSARELGAIEHEPVAVALPPGSATATILLGLAHSPAVAFPINPAFPAGFCADRLDDAGAHHLVAPYGVCSTPRLRKRIVLSPKVLLDQDKDEAPIPHPHPNAMAALILTSGSSGPPKAAALSLRNLVSNAEASNRNLPLATGDRWLLTLPLYHVAGWGVMFRCACARAAVVVPRADQDIATAITEHGVTHVSLVGTQLYRMLQSDAGRRALQGLKAILLGGSAIPPALIEEAVSLGLKIHTSYGMTEMASQVTTTPTDGSAHQLRTSGQPIIPGNVRVNEVGVIEVAGDSLFLGYLKGGRLERDVSELGWFATGDLGAWDEDGNLLVQGRRDNMFVVSGENVQPEDIERGLLAQPGVLEAKVVPAEDAERTHVPVAFVRMNPGAALDAEALRGSLKASLPRHCVPHVITSWPEAFGTGAIKVRRDEWLEAARKAVSV